MLIQLFLYNEGGFRCLGEVPAKQISVPDAFNKVHFKNKMTGEHDELAHIMKVENDTTIMKILFLNPRDENINYLKKKSIEGMLFLPRSTNHLIPVTMRKDGQTNLIWKNN